MALNPLSARERQAGIPGLITRGYTSSLHEFVTTPHVVRGATEVYDIGSTTSLTLATGPLFLSGVRFRFTSNRAWNGSPGIIVPTGCFVDVLNIECTTACTDLKNMVRVMEGARCGEIRMAAPQQVNNASNYDVSCINVVGKNVHLGHVYSEAFDKVISFGGQISNVANSGGGAHYCTLGQLTVVGYQKALQVKGSRGFRAGLIMASGRSEYSSVSPGRNVVHIDDCDMVNISQIMGRNTTEHGIYVSGGDGDNNSSIIGARSINFGEVQFADCGQCGVKIKSNHDEGPGDVNYPHLDVNIGSIKIAGAGATTVVEGEPPVEADNSDALRVENVQRLSVGSILVTPNGPYGNTSCHSGIHLAGVSNVTIGNAVIMGAEMAALRIRDFRSDNGQIMLPDVSIFDAKSHAVTVLSNTNTTRRMHIKGRADTVAGDLVRIVGPGSEAPANARSYIDMDYSNLTGSPLVRSGDADIRVRTTNLNTTHS